MFLALAFLAADATVAYRASATFNRNTGHVLRTRQMVISSNSLLSSLKDMETGQRGFLLTGRAEYLDPYRKGASEIPSFLEDLSRSADSPDQAQRIARLRLLVNAVVQEFQKTLELQQSKGAGAAISEELTNRGENEMDQIRALSAEIVAVGEQRLTTERQAALDAANSLEFLTTFGNGVMFLLLVSAVIIIRRGTQSREDLIGLLTTFVGHVPAAVAMLDRDMRYLLVSERWSVDYQLGQSRVSGRSHYEIFPALPERWKELYRRGLSGETLSSEEDIFERADGSCIWLRWEIRPWGNPGGLPEGILIFSEDITQRRESEKTIREQNERLEQIAATAPGAICTFRRHPDGSTSLPFASPGLRKMLPELPDLTLDCAPLFAAIHPDDKERVQQEIAQSARTMRPWNDEFRVLSSSMGEIWVGALFMPQRTPDSGVQWHGFLTEITERKRAEQRLLGAQHEYRELADNSPDMIARFDRECRFLLVNKRFLEVMGFSPEQLVGRRAQEVDLPANLTAEWIRAVNSVFATRSAETIEQSYPVDHHDGYWQVRLVPEFGPLGTLRSIIFIGVDITERRLAEQSLLKLKEELRALADNSPDSIARVDREGRYMFVNALVSKVTGLPEEALIGKRPDEILIPENFAQQHMESVRRIFSTGRPETFEVSYAGRGGEGNSYWEFRLIPEFSADGRVQSVLRIGIDITARRRAEAHASKSEAEVRERDALITTLFHTAPQAIIGMDTAGNIRIANRMAEELFGYQPGELLKMNQQALLPPPLGEEHQSLRESFLSSPARRLIGSGLEFQACRKDGSVFPVEVSLSQVETNRGVLAVAFAADITERKQNELTLRRSEEQLRGLSAALMTAEEDTARQIARELHDDISQRLAFLSMEIGKAAAAPSGPETQLMQLRSFQARILNVSEGIRKISHQMHPSILDDLGLSAALESMCLDLRNMEGMHVDFIASNVPEKTDRRIAFCLYRVCQESLRNVSKHARASSVRVVLSSDGESLQLAVMDSGIGFDTATRHPGLGTQSMAERVRLVNGSISFHSNPGEGTQVIACVPMKRGGHDPSSPA